MWFFALIGIIVSTLPCLHVFSSNFIKPLLKALFDCYTYLYENVIVPLVLNVIIPFITFVHNWGFFEAFLYLLSS